MNNYKGHPFADYCDCIDCNKTRQGITNNTHRIKFKVNQTYKGRENVYIVRVKKPRDIELTIANAHQLFYRHLKKTHPNTLNDWQFLPNHNFYTEFEIDSKKLDRCEVISVNKDVITSYEPFA